MIAGGHPTFAALLAAPGSPDTPLFVGADGDGDHGLTLADLRRLARRAAERFPPGSRVMLARTPASPEAPLAGVLFALLAAGVGVYLPAALGSHTAAHLDHWRAAAIIGDRRRVAGFEAPGQRIDGLVSSLAAARDVPYLDLMPLLTALGWSDGIGDGMDGTPDGMSDGTSDGIHGMLDAIRAPLPDLLCLTTSGTTGPPRALRYAEASWMACGAAFASAGLLAPDVLGGPGLCPGLCHSMGVRAAMLALWSRSPILFVQPEWPTAAPHEAARLLLAHPPRHITGGPALLGLLPAWIDAEPALRRVARGLAVAVSSGAPFDPALIERLPETRLANAFGTTETQQISTTLLDPGAPLDTLGRPLPGVALRVVDGELEVRSPFAAAGPLGEPDWPAWHRPGDRVTVDADGRLRHAGRTDDCISTGLGVELARGPVEARYADLPGVERLLVATHPDCPGLLGLAFIGARDPDTVRPALTEALHARAEAHPPEAPFEADRLWAVGLVAGHPPLIGPGKLDRVAIDGIHRPLLDALADPERSAGITLFDPADGAAPHPAWPERAPALAALGLDVRVIGGSGDRLTVERGGRRFEVLDVVGGFGVNLLGHGDPALLDVARAALDGVPICDQATAREAETGLCQDLARALARQTDRPWAVALANTGAEAVDLALRHCLLRRAATIEAHHADLRARFGAGHPEAVRAVIAENQRRAEAHRPVIVTLAGGFHGNTLSARAALGDATRRAGPFVGARTIAVPRDATEADLTPLRAEGLPLRTLIDGPEGVLEADWRPSNLLAVFAEPVQGEGGVFPIAPTVLDRLGSLDGPLVIDEIQAGLGRCGAFVAAGRAPAEVLLFGKAIGGGLAKVTAVAIHRRHLQPGFDAARGSTFAGDAVGCAVGRAVLARIEADDVPARARAIGEALGAALADLARRWPDVIAAVRGRGLLHGVALRRPTGDPIVEALAGRGWGLVAASWLLHRHHVRILPTTGAPDVLRVEPSIHFGAEDIAALVTALDGLCATIRAGDPAALLGPWVGAQIEPVAIERTPPPSAPIRVAFIHPLQSAARALTRISPGLERLSEAHRRRLLDRLLGLLRGAPLPAYAHPLFDGRVLLEGIAVCAPPAAFALAHRRGEVAPLRRAVDAALALARDRGAGIAVLGGLTSVVTDAGAALLPPSGLRVVTGNSFTAAAALEGLPGRMRAAGIDPAQATIAVLGATGNVGRAIARGLAESPPPRLLLVGRPGSRDRLDALAATLPGSITTADDPRSLAEADVILAAVNGPRPIDPAHLAADRPVLLIDVSAPSVIPPRLRQRRPNVQAIVGARVSLPRDPTARLAGVGRPGTLFACAAEGLLLALEPDLLPDAPLIGPIDPAAVAALRAAGRRWGMLR